MEMIIIRTKETQTQTMGQGFIYDESGQTLIFFSTLELPFKDNKKEISCIPSGTYKVMKRSSERFGKHFEIKDVENRSLILMHVGNYYHQTKGCILVGNSFKYLNTDNELDVVNSLETMQKLIDITPVYFFLKIIEI